MQALLLWQERPSQNGTHVKLRSRQTSNPQAAMPRMRTGTLGSSCPTSVRCKVTMQEPTYPSTVVRRHQQVPHARSSSVHGSPWRPHQRAARFDCSGGVTVWIEVAHRLTERPRDRGGFEVDFEHIQRRAQRWRLRQLRAQLFWHADSIGNSTESTHTCGTRSVHGPRCHE